MLYYLGFHHLQVNPLRIPFNKSGFIDREVGYMAEAIRLGHISGDGVFTRKCEALLEKALGSRKALLTTSCTHALEMAALLLELRPGDEVIVPSFTFPSTINAFVLHGAKPVFADIRVDTLNIDENLLPKLITSRTRAIVVVHYAGVGCEMDAILGIARKHGLMVIEDNAHGLFGRYKGKLLGSLGSLACLSFHETKNFTCGEGGSLLINEPSLVERAEIIREKGTDRSSFLRGQVSKYTWNDIGSSYAPADILAALLLAQLECAEQIQEKRKTIWNCYNGRLQSWAAKNKVRLPFVPADCEQAYPMFYMILPNLEQRQALIAHLKECGILSAFHYLPLHRSPMGIRLGGEAYACPVSEDLSDRLLRLPFYNSLTQVDQDFVIDAVLNSFKI